jgi:hypothetical protein
MRGGVRGILVKVCAGLLLDKRAKRIFVDAQDLAKGMASQIIVQLPLEHYLCCDSRKIEDKHKT